MPCHFRVVGFLRPFGIPAISNSMLKLLFRGVMVMFVEHMIVVFNRVIIVINDNRASSSFGIGVVVAAQWCCTSFFAIVKHKIVISIPGTFMIIPVLGCSTSVSVIFTIIIMVGILIGFWVRLAGSATRCSSSSRPAATTTTATTTVRADTKNLITGCILKYQYRGPGHAKFVGRWRFLLIVRTVVDQIEVWLEDIRFLREPVPFPVSRCSRQSTWAEKTKNLTT